jgi:hypothetical protein
MKTDRIPMLLVLGVWLALAMAGCPGTSGTTGPTPTFTLGATDSQFGTANDESGNTYDIALADNGDVEIMARGNNGNVTFTIDAQGRVTSATGEEGGQLNLDYQNDGSVNVSGMILIDGVLENFAGTIPAGLLPTAKVNAAGKHLLTASVDDPFVVCVAIDAFCDLLPVLIDEVINVVSQQLLEELGLKTLVDTLLLGQEFQFPTGLVLIDDPLRQAVREKFPIIVQVEGFCTIWELLELDICS